MERDLDHERQREQRIYRGILEGRREMDAGRIVTLDEATARWKSFTEQSPNVQEGTVPNCTSENRFQSSE